MTQTIVNTIVTFLISGILGYCVNIIKTYKKKLKEREDKVFNELEKLKKSQLADMKSNLSNKFFVYDAMEEVDDYLVEGFRKDCERYFDMDGDSWIHPMYDKSFQWKIKQTGYLK